MARDKMLAAQVDAHEKRLVERAAERADETVSSFVRTAALRRTIEVARELPEPEPKEEVEGAHG